MALAAGFGLDLMTADPEVLEALTIRLDQQARERKAAEMKAELEQRMGRR